MFNIEQQQVGRPQLSEYYIELSAWNTARHANSFDFLVASLKDRYILPL